MTKLFHYQLCRIIEAATIRPPNVQLKTAVPCRRAKYHGHIKTIRLEDTIEWECSDCTDKGTVSHWKDTPEDISEFIDDISDEITVKAILSPYEYSLLIQPGNPSLYAPRLICSAVNEQSRVALKGTAHEFSFLTDGMVEALPSKKGLVKKVWSDMIGYFDILGRSEPN